MLRYLTYLFVLSFLVGACQPVPTAVSSTPTATRLPTTTATFTPSPTSPPPTKTPIVNKTIVGRMTRDETWSGEILIKGDIEIPQNVTLTIEPGTIVQFTAQKDILRKGGEEDFSQFSPVPNDPPQIGANMIEITLIGGTLIAQGTPTEPITFTSDSLIPALNDWSAIVIGDNSKLVLTYSIIEFNYNGVVLDYENADAEIHHNIFRHIAACGICNGGWNAIVDSVEITNNIFEDIHHEAIDTNGNQNIIIRNNLFRNNVVGVIAIKGSTVLIEGNIFENNEGAIGVIENSSPVIHGNNFYNNGNNVGTHISNPLVDAENNWWNTTDIAQIRKLIRGNIDYEPFAIEPFEIEIGLPFELQTP